MGMHWLGWGFWLVTAALLLGAMVRILKDRSATHRHRPLRENLPRRFSVRGLPQVKSEKRSWLEDSRYSARRHGDLRSDCRLAPDPDPTHPG